MNNIAPKTEKMLDTKNCLQHNIKNAKSTKLLLQLAFYTSKGRTCKVVAFYEFWFKFHGKFCSPHTTVDFYAYLVTKIRKP